MCVCVCVFVHCIYSTSTLLRLTKHLVYPVRLTHPQTPKIYNLMHTNHLTSQT